MKRALAACAISLGVLFTPISARAYCSTPDAPYCASEYGAFDDEDDFNSCKREMESYRDDVENYVECVAEEARDAIDEAKSDYDDAVSDFNRRANN